MEFNDIEVSGLLDMIKTLQQAKRIIKIVIGFTLLITGLAMVVLPGPAILVIPAGLAILATEFVWAKRLLGRMKNRNSWHIK